MSDCERCSGPPGETAHCHLCHEDFPPGTTLIELTDHLRVIHPDHFGDGPATWPDGEMVIFDDTLTPEDFSDGLD
jgi:hypothetical protein